MLGGHEMHSQPGQHLAILPPVQLDGAADAFTREISAVAEARNDRRSPARLEPPEAREIHMVVVIVAQENQMNGRQIVEGNAGIANPLGA